jgi:hypothetical protein
MCLRSLDVCLRVARLMTGRAYTRMSHDGRLRGRRAVDHVNLQPRSVVSMRNSSAEAPVFCRELSMRRKAMWW